MAPSLPKLKTPKAHYLMLNTRNRTQAHSWGESTQSEEAIDTAAYNH